jgi:hypothetical protein
MASPDLWYAINEDSEAHTWRVVTRNAGGLAVGNIPSYRLAQAIQQALIAAAWSGAAAVKDGSLIL